VSEHFASVQFAFVYPLLLYGIEVYANRPTAANHLSTLRILNNKLLRILQRKPSRTHTAELYKAYHTLPTQLLHNYQILIFMHKYAHYRSRLPPAFSTHFDENKLIHQHNTRQNMTFILILSNLKSVIRLLHLKVVNCGIICQQILKKYSHVLTSDTRVIR